MQHNQSQSPTTPQWGARRWLWPSIAAMGVAGAMALGWWRTSYGPAVGPDGVMYLETAESLLAGRGLWADGVPMTHYGPGYPLLLAIAALVQGEGVFESSRWLHTSLLGLNALLLGQAVRASTGRSVLAGVLAMLLLLTCEPAVRAHHTIASEALFVALMLAGLLLLSRSLRSGGHWSLLFGAASLGLAMATRYAGVALLAPLLLTLLAHPSTRQRPLLALPALVLTCSPLGLWLARNALIGGTATNRALFYHPPNSGYLTDFARALHGLLLSVEVPGWLEALGLVLVTGLIAGALAMLHRRRPLIAVAPKQPLALLWLAFALAYTIVLAATRTFVDAQTPADSRILLPLWMALVVIIISLAYAVSQATGKRAFWWALVLVSVVAIGINGTYTWERSRSWHRNGSRYSGKTWRRSPTIAAVSCLPTGTIVYSNGYDVIRFLTNHEALTVPRHTNPNSLQPYPDYAGKLEAMCQAAATGRGVVVYLREVTWRDYMPDREAIVDACELSVLQELDDGIIYGSADARLDQTLR